MSVIFNQLNFKMKSFLILFALLFTLVISGPTNCNANGSGNSLSFGEPVLDLDILEADMESTENCFDAYVCQIGCTCSNGSSKNAMFRIDPTSTVQNQIYQSICTTTYPTSYLALDTATGDNFRLDLIQAFFNNNTLLNSLNANGIKIPIALQLKSALVTYLQQTEAAVLQVGKTCCKPQYSDNSKLRTLFWVMSLEFFNSYAEVKALCENDHYTPMQAIEQVFTSSISGKPYDLTAYANVIPQIQGVKNLLLQVYLQTETQYCSCTDMINYGKNVLSLNTASMQSIVQCNC